MFPDKGGLWGPKGMIRRYGVIGRRRAASGGFIEKRPGVADRATESWAVPVIGLRRWAWAGGPA